MIGTPANAIGGDVLRRSGGVWVDDDNTMRFPSELSAIVLDPRINFPITSVGQCPDGFLVRMDVTRTETGIMFAIGEYREVTP